MSDPLVIVSAVALFVPLLVGALAYLGTRGSTRVAAEKRLDERDERSYRRLEDERDREALRAERLAADLAACQARESARSASVSARLAADIVVDAATAAGSDAPVRKEPTP